MSKWIKTGFIPLRAQIPLFVAGTAGGLMMAHLFLPGAALYVMAALLRNAEEDE